MKLEALVELSRKTVEVHWSLLVELSRKAEGMKPRSLLWGFIPVVFQIFPSLSKV